MVWHQIGDKPLSETMLTRFTDAYMQHQGDELSYPSNMNDWWMPKYTNAKIMRIGRQTYFAEFKFGKKEHEDT